MTDPGNTTPLSEEDERFRTLLLHGDQVRRTRQLHRRIPNAPRCKMCLAPFGGVGGALMSFLGHSPWAKNPKYCTGCFRTLREHHGGAEVECSLLFADVRGSTTLGERMHPRDFNRLMGRFYDTGFAILADHDALVDKFVGDEIIGIFVPGMAGEEHAQKAVDAARRLLSATGHGGSSAPWLPVGAGISTGTAYVGCIGEGPDTELTAMGDLVNTTARLASVAAAGEILVTLSAASAAGLSEALPHRSLELKGKRSLTEVVVLASGAVRPGLRPR